MTSPQAHAGWYLDPQNPAGQRYWDGAAWTAQSRDLTSNPGRAPVSPDRLPATAPQPGWEQLRNAPAHQHPLAGNQPPHPYPDAGQWPAMTHSSTVVVVNTQQKSVGVAFLLTFFFGALGLFYSTVVGGLIMTFLMALFLVLGFVTLGVGWVLFSLAWIVCIPWGCIAASSGGKTPTVTTTHSGVNYRGG